MKDRKPAVIVPSELASILRTFIENVLTKMPEDEVFEVMPDSNPKATKAEPSLSIVIRFDPETFEATTVSISRTKRAVKDWNISHGV